MNDKKVMDWSVKIVLIIIIVILLIHNCELKKNKNEGKTPTGNVDIIEINCNSSDKCDDPVIDDGKKNNQDWYIVPVSGDDNDNQDGHLEGFTVEDQNITWDSQVDAKIFTNSMYELDDIIAPEDANTYQFVVKNNTKFKLKYHLSFVENNAYGINMKYKIKKNDTYLVDHYVSARELNTIDFMLNKNDKDTYYLEWKWISSNNDTKVGKTPDAFYGLKIEVKAESSNG